MPIRAYRDIFTACFESNSILYYELISKCEPLNLELIGKIAGNSLQNYY